MTRVLLTGVAGFIGSHVGEILLRHKNKVLGVDDLSTSKLEVHEYNLQGFKKAGGEFYLCDVTQQKLAEIAFYDFKPEVVIHLAAQSAITKAIKEPKSDLHANGMGTLTMLQLAKKHKVDRFVFASTSAVYREKQPFWGSVTEVWPCEPANPYGISKLACEQYIRTMFPNHFICRLGNVYGPRQRGIGENQVIARAFEHFIHGNDFKVVGHGNQKRDYVYVEDVAFAFFDGMLSDVIGTFNIATGKSHSVNQVLAEIEEIFDVPGYKWDHTQENDPRGNVGLNVLSAKHKVGWRSQISLGEGLKRTADWWKELYNG